jgi:hypothetical protein
MPSGIFDCVTAGLNTLGQSLLEASISLADKEIPSILYNKKTHCHFTFMWPCIVTSMWPCIVTFMWPCIVTNFFIIKPARCTNFSNLFWNEKLHVSDNSSVHHQELFTVHLAMFYVIQTGFEQQDQDVPCWSCCCSKAVYKPVWHIPLLCAQWKTPDDGQRNCPKHVEFHYKINLRN